MEFSKLQFGFGMAGPAWRSTAGRQTDNRSLNKPSAFLLSLERNPQGESERTMPLFFRVRHKYDPGPVTSWSRDYFIFSESDAFGG